MFNGLSPVINITLYLLYCIVTDDGRKVDPKDSFRIKDTFRNCFQSCQRRFFNKKTLHKRLPIFRWLPGYSSSDGICDLVAGISVGLTVIPQALAYADIAGLPAAVSAYVIYIYSISSNWYLIFTLT